MVQLPKNGYHFLGGVRTQSDKYHFFFLFFLNPSLNNTYVSCCVRRCICIKEKVDNLRMSLLSCLMKRTVTKLILDIDADAIGQQKLDHVNLAKVSSHMKRSVTCLCFSITICSTINLKIFKCQQKLKFQSHTNRRFNSTEFRGKSQYFRLKNVKYNVSSPTQQFSIIITRFCKLRIILKFKVTGFGQAITVKTTETLLSVMQFYMKLT